MTMAPAESRQLSAFMHLNLDGCFCDPRGDMSFAHKPPDDAEWQEFVAENAAGSGVLVFGRTTYDHDGRLVAYVGGRQSDAGGGGCRPSRCTRRRQVLPRRASTVAEPHIRARADVRERISCALVCR